MDFCNPYLYSTNDKLKRRTPYNKILPKEGELYNLHIGFFETIAQNLHTFFLNVCDSDMHAFMQ